MSTSVERVLNNPYLLADIMRYVAQMAIARNVLSTLCVSRAFRNPHVISEALRSITYIYKPLRDKVTGDSVMSCVDIDHVSGVVERSELKIDCLLCDGGILWKEEWRYSDGFNNDILVKDNRIEHVYIEESLFERTKQRNPIQYVTVTQIGAHAIQLETFSGYHNINKFPSFQAVLWSRIIVRIARGCKTQIYKRQTLTCNIQ